MASIAKIQSGQTLWDVSRGKMGNTNISTITVYAVTVLSVHDGYAICSWNGNKPCLYSEYSIKRLKVSKPVTIPTWNGYGARLATASEKKELLKSTK